MFFAADAVNASSNVEGCLFVLEVVVGVRGVVDACAIFLIGVSNFEDPAFRRGVDKIGECDVGRFGMYGMSIVKGSMLGKEVVCFCCLFTFCCCMF